MNSELGLEICSLVFFHKLSIPCTCICAHACACTVVTSWQCSLGLHQSISVSEWAGWMDGWMDGWPGGGGRVHVMYFCPLLSPAQALRVKWLLFTASRKWIDAKLIRGSLSVWDRQRGAVMEGSDRRELENKRRSAIISAYIDQNISPATADCSSTQQEVDVHKSTIWFWRVCSVC